MHTSSLRRSPEAASITEPVRAIPKPGTNYGYGRRHATEAIGEEFKPPTVRIGERVLFYANADRNSSPANAFVVALQTTQLVLDVLKDGKTKRCINVRHVGDPMAATANMRRWGAWDAIKTVADERVDALEARVSELEGHVERLLKLEARLKKPKQPETLPAPE